MQLVRIYECLCDRTRLRILHLLARGPLCVCHLQELLGEPQVKISRHLAFLRERRVLEVRRHQNWMIYSLPARPSAELRANLQCLQDCVQTDPVFKADRKRLRTLLPEVKWTREVQECGARPRAKTKARLEVAR